MKTFFHIRPGRGYLIMACLGVTALAALFSLRLFLPADAPEQKKEKERSAETHVEGTPDPVLVSRARAALQSGSPKEAIALFRRALEQAPRDTAALKDLAEAFLAMGSKHEAVNTYRRVLSIDDDQAARLALAELYQSDQSFLDAISLYQAAIKREPQKAALVEALAICHAAIGETKQALVLFQRANELEAGRRFSLDGMARILALDPKHVDSDNEASLQYALAAAKITGRRQPQVLSALAAAYAVNGQFEQAVAVAVEGKSLSQRAGVKMLVDQFDRQLASYRKKERWLYEVKGNSVRDMAEERRRLDETTFAAERRAQFYEKTIVQLWDSLLGEEKLLALGKVQFDKLVNRLPGASREFDAGIPGIRMTRPSPTTETLSPDEFSRRLRAFGEQGWSIVETEWHHTSFEMKTASNPPRSVVSATIHVENTLTEKRVIIRAKLRVNWTDGGDQQGNPLPGSIEVSDYEMFDRSGPLAFQPLLTVDPVADATYKSEDVLPLLLHDLNHDDLSEIVLGGCNLVYWNRGEGKFDKQEFVKHPLPINHPGLLVDVTGDHVVDFLAIANGKLMLWRGEAEGRFPSKPQTLFDGSFVMPQAMTAGDMDGDNDLDLFIVQYKRPYTQGQMPSPYYDANDGRPAYLLRNDGVTANGRLSVLDVTEASGLGQKRYRRSYSASFTDLNDDGTLDLVVVSDFAGIDMYLNNGAGRFRDVTADAIDNRYSFGMSHALSDFNADGQIDLYMTGMGSTTARRLDRLGIERPGFEEHNLRRKDMGYGNRMYLGQGDGHFAQPSIKDQLARSGWSWGCTASDFDNDGDVDIFIANGFVSGKSTKDYCTRFWCHDTYVLNSRPDFNLYQVFLKEAGPMIRFETSWNGYEHNVLFVSRGGEQYVNLAFLLGVSSELDSRAVASEDLDLDGDRDLLFTARHMPFGVDKNNLYVLRNDLGSKNNWIGVRLDERSGKTSPIGAKVYLFTETEKRIAHVVTGDSFCTQHAATAHFGLGNTGEVQRIEIVWPNSQRTVLKSPAINRYHDVRAGDDG